ncbi:MAG: hypothetical protein EXR89_00895 [Methylococcaceae bacterium]|nr:hypothetical protein [Methylococcaceae bacterium]
MAYLAAITGNVFAEPAITGASATGTTIKFTVQLSEKLFSGYKVKIDLNNGKGFVAMKCSALTCTLSSNALPKGVDDASYSVGIYDSKGALQGETVESSYVITAMAEVNAVPPASQVNTVPTSTTGTIKTDMPVPSITNASASPSAITQGSSLTFSAVLSSNLPSSYSVTLSYGNTSVYMSGSGTNYSVVQTPSQFGQQIFTVGIYDANNTLKSNSMTGNFEIVKANTFPMLSFMSGNTTATVGTPYSVQLQGNDSDNNLSLITINWGDGSSNSQNASNGSTLTFSHTYSSVNSFTWSATAIDSANASSSAVSKTVSVST